MKIRELYTDESKWTQYTEARNYEGDEISLNHPLAVSFCLIGAVWKCYPDAESRKKICDKITNKIDMSIDEWNDKEERTFAQVKALADELDI